MRLGVGPAKTAMAEDRFGPEAEGGVGVCGSPAVALAAPRGTAISIQQREAAIQARAIVAALTQSPPPAAATSIMPRSTRASTA